MRQKPSKSHSRPSMDLPIHSCPRHCTSPRSTRLILQYRLSPGEIFFNKTSKCLYNIHQTSVGDRHKCGILEYPAFGLQIVLYQ